MAVRRVCESLLLFAAAALAAGPARAGEAKLTKPPKLLHFVEAEYPQKERALGVVSTVVLSIEIALDGSVTSVDVVESGGADFDQAAVAAAKGFVFEPAEVDGKPAQVKILYRYEFTLRVEEPERKPEVNFEGVVLERFQKKPLSGIRVAIDDIETSTLTKETGQFHFLDVPAGRHKVEVSGPNLIRMHIEETIAEDQKLTVTYLVEEKSEGVDEEQIIRAPRIRRESTEISLSTEEGRLVPGTQGDTLKVVQNLPGVARSAAGSGALVVWGSAPKETRVLVDGVEIPALYHIGGLRSTLSSDLVKTINLVPGAFGADYGRGLGGLVLVQTKPLPEEGVHGYVGADIIDASGLVSAVPVERLRIAAAGRYSYLDRLLSGIVSPDVGDTFPIPQYSDYQLKADLSLGRDEDLCALFMGSNDRLRRSIPSTDPTTARSERTDLSFYRGSIRYSRLLPSGASLSITPSLVFDDSSRTSAFGRVPALLSISSLHYGLRASYREKVRPTVALAIGADVLGTRSHVMRSGSITVPPREGDVFVFGQPPGEEVNADDFRTEIANLALFATAEIEWGSLTVTPGLRLDAFALDGSRLLPKVGETPEIGYSRLEGALDPRIAIRYRLTPAIELRAASGIYHQAPEPEELSAVFGTPSLGVSRAVHFTAGGAIDLTGTLTAEVTGFYKLLNDLVVRSPLPTPELAHALAQDGEGRSYGAQLLVRQELAQGFFGWLSYAVGRSERVDRPGQTARLFDFDQTHVLTLVASYEAGAGFIFGARLRYSTGFPRTPVVGAFFDSRGDQYQPIFGSTNTARIPDFFQLDLRCERAFELDGARLRAYLDLENVTYRKNPEEIIYNYNFTENKYITGLPLLAVFGARLEF